MKKVLLIILLLTSGRLWSQQFIGLRPAQVLRKLENYGTPAGYEKPEISQNDSTVSMFVKGSNGISTRFIYRFDKQSGTCRSEQVQASCDSCFRKYLDGVLAQKKYQWKKINENQYVSAYSKKRMIELPAETNDFSYKILKTGWSKKLYRLLMGQ